MMEDKMLKKRKTIILVAVLVIMLIAFLIVWCNIYLHDPEKIYINRDGQSVVLFGDDYLYSNDDGLFSCENNECVCDIKGEKVLSVSGDKLYVYLKDSGEIRALSGDFKSEMVGKIKSGYDSFAFYDNMFFAANSGNGNGFMAYDAELKECSFEKSKTKAGSCKIYKLDKYTAVTMEDTNISKNMYLGVEIFDSSKQTDNSILWDECGYFGDFEIPYYTNDRIITTNGLHSSLSDIRLTDEIKKDEIELPNIHTALQIKMSGDSIVWAGMDCNGYGSSSQWALDGHYNDYITVISKETFKKTAEHKTRKHERILYYDSQKAITFYDGYYITYSVDDWKETSKKKATEIKKGGKYTFEACGEYLFVFDDNTGECINRIKV